MEYNPNDIHNLIQQEKWKPIRQIIKHIIETNKIPIPRKLKNTYKNIQRIKQLNNEKRKILKCPHVKKCINCAHYKYNCIGTPTPTINNNQQQYTLSI